MSGKIDLHGSKQFDSVGELEEFCNEEEVSPKSFYVTVHDNVIWDGEPLQPGLYNVLWNGDCIEDVHYVCETDPLDTNIETWLERLRDSVKELDVACLCENDFDRERAMFMSLHSLFVIRHLYGAKSKITCLECILEEPIAVQCEWAFDMYNTDGDCLMAK